MNAWRNRLARWFDRPARASPLSPNQITLIALVINIAAAACMYAGTKRPALFLIAIGLVSVGGLADAFDGIVARVQGKASRYGDFLDHVADRVSDTALAAGWMLGNGVRDLLLVMALVAVGMNGYIGTQIEATWRERNYETIGRGEFLLAFVVLPILSYILVDNGWQSLTFSGLSIAEWLTAALTVVALVGIGQRLLLASRLERTR